MINLRQQTVNVSRVALIGALHAGLKIHREQLAEAQADYEAAVIQFQADALARANSGDFKDMRLTLTAPQDQSQEYLDVIALMEVSVDETVQIDKEAFKAFYQNKWPWTSAFELSASTYKAALGKA